MSEFEPWLSKKLKDLEADESVLLPYISWVFCHGVVLLYATLKCYLGTQNNILLQLLIKKSFFFIWFTLSQDQPSVPKLSKFDYEW